MTKRTKRTAKTERKARIRISEMRRTQRQMKGETFRKVKLAPDDPNANTKKARSTRIGQFAAFSSGACERSELKLSLVYGISPCSSLYFNRE